MLGINAAAEGSQKETAVVFRMRGEMQFREERQTRSFSYRWKQRKGEDKANVKKEETLTRCTLLNGSAWSPERKYMRRCKGKCDIFFGIEHRSRKEDMEEQFNREAEERWRFAADAARITNERASNEEPTHTSGGVFVAVDSNPGAVVGAEE